MPFTRPGALPCCSRNHALHFLALCFVALEIMPFTFCLFLSALEIAAFTFLFLCLAAVEVMPFNSWRCLSALEIMPLTSFWRFLSALEIMPLASLRFALQLSKSCPSLLGALPCCSRFSPLKGVALHILPANAYRACSPRCSGGCCSVASIAPPLLVKVLLSQIGR